MNIDFDKVKRIFAFGCSFTNHCYPTWADVVASEMPNAFYCNLGIPGFGNHGIACRVSEANQRFKFCDTDLILVMYSTTFREDRFIGSKWKSFGSVFNNDFYDRQFIEKYVDPIGMVIRDLAMMNLTNTFIKSLPSQHIILRSVPIDDESDNSGFNNTNAFKNIIETYSDLLNSMPPNLLELELENIWNRRTTYEFDGKIVEDSHPTPDIYHSYLKKIGLNLTEKSEVFVRESMGKLNTCKTIRDLQNAFVRDFNTLNGQML